jgi:methionine aminopeptidase
LRGCARGSTFVGRLRRAAAAGALMNRSERSESVSGVDLGLMRESCQLAAETLCVAGEQLRAGMTTDEINTIVHEFIVAHNAYPSPLNYRGFPKSVCTSVNEVVCHGIPDGTALKNGDIVNVDVTTYFPVRNGFHGDTSATFYIGEPSPHGAPCRRGRAAGAGDRHRGRRARSRASATSAPRSSSSSRRRAARWCATTPATASAGCSTRAERAALRAAGTGPASARG